MNFVRQPIETPSFGVAVTEDPAALRTFLEPGCAAAIWQRQMPPETRDWLGALAPHLLPQGRVILPAHAVADTVNQLCDISGLPPGPHRDWLEDDIVDLAGLFTQLMSARFLRLRIDKVTTNACRRFHVDAIRARLVCTYRGTGTQYGIAARDADPDQVFTVPTGAPILLRGSLWPAEPPSGLLHRSPPIEGTGETRMVLVLDPVLDPDDAA